MANQLANKRITKKTYIYEYEYIVERINAFHANKMCAHKHTKKNWNK